MVNKVKTQDDPLLDLTRIFENLKTSFEAAGTPNFQQRYEHLQTLEDLMVKYSEEIVSAIVDDFSHRSNTEIENFEITSPIGDIRFAKKKLKRWMRPKKVHTPKHLMPAKGRVHPQPLGVVGIISPWNFPVYLSIGPIATALAAGNRVMLKPSELSPKTSALLKKMLSEGFDDTIVSVIIGEVDVASAFSQLPFDHLLFTGSTKVGRLVAIEAAKNLTPVTLELGGKSPAIVTPSADLEKSARRIAWGKTTNSGQICIAPDYVLVPEAELDAFIAHCVAAVQDFYPDGLASPDYGGIISERHKVRLETMVEEAENSGVKVIHVLEGKGLDNARKLPPTIIVNPPQNLSVMREEIFGPILPVISYKEQKGARDFVSAGDRPLALYVFASEHEDRDFWLDNTISGAVTVNDTLLHVVFDSLPFGGVGASGIGAYHGDKGFETFSHMKSVMYQSKFNMGFVFEPPFTGLKSKLPHIFRKVI